MRKLNKNEKLKEKQEFSPDKAFAVLVSSEINVLFPAAARRSVYFDDLQRLESCHT